MKFSLNIRCDNDAFEGEQLGKELARILTHAAATFECIGFVHNKAVAVPLRDANGNTVGLAEMEID